MKPPLFRKQILWLVVISFITTMNVSAQYCVVGGTNFDTDASLFNPVITDWMDENIGDELDGQCGGSCLYYEEVYKGRHIGMLSNSMSSGGTLFTPALWETIQDNGNNPPSRFFGGSAIVVNPKLIDPRLMEYDNNMFVNAGATHEKAFFSYALSGLEPGSSVTFTADVYNLLDLDAAKAYSVAHGGGNFSFGGYVYNAYLNQYHGNANIAINGSTSVNNNGAVQGGVSTGTIGFGKSKKLIISGIVDVTGSVTFYLGRPGGINFAPIGIDNIEITGSIKPKVITEGINPFCMGDAVAFGLKETYPPGTTYKWFVDGVMQTTTSARFTYELGTNPSYTIKAQVTLPVAGCSPVESDELVVSTTLCCGNALKPQSSKVLFYDDFGSFPSGYRGGMYQWTDDNGLVHSMDVTNTVFGTYSAVCSQRAVTIGVPCGTTTTDDYSIVGMNPYNTDSNVAQYDHTSGDGTGGMMFVDLKSNAYMGKTIYSRKISNLCQGKTVSFSMWVASATNKPDEQGITTQIRIIDQNGMELYEETKNFKGYQQWQKLEAEFPLAPGVTSVTLEINNLGVCSRDGNGDYLIDDVKFTACAPSIVLIDAKDYMKDLMEQYEDPMTLYAIETDKIIQYYEIEPYYLFQWTHTNPQGPIAPHWENVGPKQSNNEFIIPLPKDHPAFQDGIGRPYDGPVYFRVVVGKASQIDAQNALGWDNIDSKNVCLEFSISDIPVIAGLGCPECPRPKDIKIKADKDLKSSIPIKIVELWPEESVTLTSNEITPESGYTNYTFQWYKGDKSTSIGSASKGVQANPLTVTHNNTGSITSDTMYYIQVIDSDFPDAIYCHKWDSIRIIEKVTPQISAKTDIICSGETFAINPETTPGGDIVPVGTTYTWDVPMMAGINGLSSGNKEADISGTLINTTDNPISVTYKVTPTSDGCNGDEFEIVITVNPVPTLTEILIPEFKQGESPDLSQTKTAMNSIDFDKYDMLVDLKGILTPITSAEDMIAAIDNLALTSAKSPYTFEYTLTDKTTGCISDPGNITIRVIVPVPTSIDKITSAPLNLYPNPVRKNTHLTLDIGQETITGESVWLEVYNTRGILLRQLPVSSPRIEIRSESTEGIYLYIIRNQDRILESVKVMVK
ncbi:PKD-like domain-containing protein [uncultured Parabacteroides sp.]|uniref:PKD-like domain-containing protein n=1 Tax=uncultured Parabacteroides sp. TaxID=512312 RepID=UPI0025F18EB9|nr:PKD-like domain-containing protein [uncultured Parabacteroides sp.]